MVQRFTFGQGAGFQCLEIIDVQGPLRSNNAEVLLAAALAGKGDRIFSFLAIQQRALQEQRVDPASARMGGLRGGDAKSNTPDIPREPASLAKSAIGLGLLSERHWHAPLLG